MTEFVESECGKYVPFLSVPLAVKCDDGKRVSKIAEDKTGNDTEKEGEEEETKRRIVTMWEI